MNLTVLESACKLGIKDHTLRWRENRESWPVSMVSEVLPHSNQAYSIGSFQDQLIRKVLALVRSVRNKSAGNMQHVS